LRQLALKNGGGLKYIFEQNYRLCLSVLRKNGRELAYVRPYQFTNEQYFNICKAAVENEYRSILYVDDEELGQKQYQELCETAVNLFYGIFHLINREKIPANLYHTWCKNALEKEPLWIKEIPYSKHYYGFCLKAVRKDGEQLENIKYLRLTKDQYAAVCKAAVKQNKEAEQYIIK